MGARSHNRPMRSPVKPTKHAMTTQNEQIAQNQQDPQNQTDFESERTAECEQSGMCLLDLPYCVLERILITLDARDVFSCAMTCSEFKSVAYAETLWNAMARGNWVGNTDISAWLAGSVQGIFQHPKSQLPAPITYRYWLYLDLLWDEVKSCACFNPCSNWLGLYKALFSIPTAATCEYHLIPCMGWWISETRLCSSWVSAPAFSFARMLRSPTDIAPNSWLDWFALRQCHRSYDCRTKNHLQVLFDLIGWVVHESRGVLCTVAVKMSLVE